MAGARVASLLEAWDKLVSTGTTGTSGLTQNRISLPHLLKSHQKLFFLLQVPELQRYLPLQSRQPHTSQMVGPALHPDVHLGIASSSLSSVDALSLPSLCKLHLSK